MEIAAGVEILPQNLQSLEDIGPEFHLHSIYVRINVWKTFTIFESVSDHFVLCSRWDIPDYSGSGM